MSKIDKAVKNMPQFLSIPVNVGMQMPLYPYQPTNEQYSQMQPYNNYFPPPVPGAGGQFYPNANNEIKSGNQPQFGQNPSAPNFGNFPQQMMNPYFMNYPVNGYSMGGGGFYPNQTMPANMNQQNGVQQSFVMNNQTFHQSQGNFSELAPNNQFQNIKLGQNAKAESSNVEFIKLPESMMKTGGKMDP